MKKLSALLVAFFTVLELRAQPTAFTYQGRLNDGANPANGSYDLTFALFDAASVGNQVGGTVTNAATAVRGGLFTVTLDFGNQFSGSDRWLEIGVATNGAGGFTILSPRQLLTATPYAVRAVAAASADTAINANTATIANAVNASNILGAITLLQLPAEVVTNGAGGVNLSGAFSGDGAGLSNISPASINGVLSAAQIPGLDGGKITTGTVDLARLPGGLVTNGASGVNFSGTFSGSGAGLSGVDLRNINSLGAIAWATNHAFIVAAPLSVGPQPRSVASADVNGDGKLDLISANSGINTLSVMTNNGSGGFVLAGLPTVGNSPYSVLTGDVNGDGRPDLISANVSGANISVLTNNGSGGFVLSSSPFLSAQPYSIVSGDINNDGQLDLITANPGSGTLSLVTNAGNGTFVVAGALFPGASSPISVTAADVNGDGKLDLICANNGSATLSLFTNNGTGNFVLTAPLSVGSSPLSVTAADVNGDGKLDLISANSGSSTLSVLTNKGSGDFVLSSSPAVGLQPSFVKAADINGDGKVDLISANNNTSTLSILTNNGSGGFALAASPNVGTTPCSVAAGDWNGDGQTDLASANVNGASLSVVFNSAIYGTSFTGNGGGLTNLNANYFSSGTVPLAQLPSAVVTNGETGVSITGTFSGSGAGLTGVDLRTVNSLNAIVWTTNVSFANSFTLGAGTSPRSVAIADVNADGRMDLIGANSGSGTLTIYTNNGFGGFSVSSSPSLSAGPYSVAAADVNGDGKVDAITANPGQNNLTIVTNNGTGTFLIATTVGTGGSGPIAVAAADMNADGRVDVVAVNNSSFTVSVLTNNGIGGFFLAATPSGVGNSPYSVTTADINNDGRMDVICANNGTTTISILTNNGTGALTLVSSPTVGFNPTAVKAADVNGDGRPDLITANNGTTTLSVLTNNGSGGFILATSPNLGTPPSSVATGDFNGDGRVDLVCANISANSLAILINNGSSFTLATTVGVGASPLSVVAGDLNGDGRLDLACANLNSSSLSIAMSTTSPSQASFFGNGAGLTNLTAANIAGTLLDAQLSPNVALRNANNTFTALNNFTNLVGLLDVDIRLRGTGDGNHGLGWYGTTGPIKAFDGINVDGPALYGFAGGVLGTTSGGQNMALHWNSSGNVGIGTTAGGSRLTVSGTVSASSFSGSGSGLSSLPSSSLSGAIPSGLLTSVPAGNLTGSVPSAALTSVPAGNLTGTVNDLQLSPNVALQNAANTFSGNNTFSGSNSFTGLNGFFDTDLRFRNVADSNHGVGYYGAGKPFPGFDLDGPVLYGYSGGGLGTSTNGKQTTLVWDNWGQVGIGTTAPSRPLQIGSSSFTNHAMIRLGSGNGTAQRQWDVGVQYGGTNVTSPNYDFAITDVNAGTPRLLIDWQTGNVGIGINDPANKLHVAGGGTFSGSVTASSFVGGFTGNGASMTNLDASSLGSGIVSNARLSNNVALLDRSVQTFTGGTNSFSGNVGIGTNGPAVALDILRSTASQGDTASLRVSTVSGDTAGPNLRLVHNGPGGRKYGIWSTGSGNIGGAGLLQFADETAGASRMVINGAGNVGIGTNNPVSALHVVGNVLASGSVTAASFVGDGSALTALNPTNLNGTLLANVGLRFSGNRTNGFTNAVVYLQNTNTSAAAAPALRVQNDGGNTPNGALSVSANVTSTATNSIIAQFGNASSFVVVITNDGTIYSKGVALTSDRNAKESFRAVDGKLILEKVAALPMSEWDYKDTPGIRHLGPMAQDFHAAFGLNGPDNTRISVVDQGGVALAAIQGLNKKVETRSATDEERIRKLETENAELKSRLEKLETSLNRRTN